MNRTVEELRMSLAWKRRRVVLTLTAAFLVSFLAAVPIGASAGTASSSVGSFSSGGHSYTNQAVIHTSTGSASAQTLTAPSGYTAPAGWVGSRGRLFASGGTLSCESSNLYSTGSLVSGQYWSQYSCTRTTTGAWYSYGVSLVWNGSGYNSVYTFQSPNQNS
jgi:hypothetical protein